MKFQPVPLYLLTNCSQPLADYILSFVNETFKIWDGPPTPIVLNITFPCSYCQKTFPIKIFKNYLKEWRYGAIVESTQRVKGNFWHTARIVNQNIALGVTFMNTGFYISGWLPCHYHCPVVFPTVYSTLSIAPKNEGKIWISSSVF